MLNASRISTAKTKDEFLNRAHEAREARELARRQDNAATILQSYVRRLLTWKKLRRGLIDEHEKIRNSLSSNDCELFIRSLRRIFYISQVDKDRDAIDELLRYIYNATLTSVNNLSDNFNSKSEIRDEEIGELKTSLHSPTLLLLEEASKNEYSYLYCLHLMSKIVSLCCQLVQDSLTTQFEVTQVVVYISIVNLLTIRRPVEALIFSMKDALRDDEIRENLIKTYKQFVYDMSKRTLKMRKDLFSSVSNSITKMIKGVRIKTKAILLDEYIQLALNISTCLDEDVLLVESSSNPTISSSSQEQIGFLVKLLSMPALIYHLDHYSQKSIALFKEHSTLKFCLRIMSTHNQQLQNLSSIPALCLVANLIHLSSINDEVLKEDKNCFVMTITKLLECCRKKMKHSLIITQPELKKSIKKTSYCRDESYNHILGWLTRESVTIDQETSNLIKSQLSNLWSVKFLELLLSDLIKANENQLRRNSNTTSNGRTSKSKNSVDETSKRFVVKEHIQTSCDITSSNAPISSFRKAIERAAYNMTKSIGYPHNKTTCSSGLHSACAKLLTEESRSISHTCFMLHSALQTLRIIKQDILTGLCFHDYVLKNLWDYISSLSSYNGLKAFLDLLIINSKSSLPEFHILMLFCECSSHITSILDDSELYEQQKPFSLEDLVNISAFLNTFVYKLISNQLVSYKVQEMDPILQSTHKFLTDLYKRDCRRKFAPQDHWLIRDLKISLFLKDLDAGKPVARAILNFLPHIIPHKERVLIFRKLVAKDRSTGYSTYITIHRSRIVEDGYQQLARLPSTALKGPIRVKFINDHGLDEAGIDQDGVFKEFLEDTIKRVFDPSLNLFSTTSENRLYPSPTSRLHEDHLSLFNFVGKMLGKAVYEGIVVDVPFASFFLARVLGHHHCALYSPIDDLASLDAELYKNLIYIRHHDVNELDLTFSLDQDMMGKIENFELEPGGKHIPVTNQNRVRYIHSVANYRMRTQIEEQTEAFVRGFKSIVNLDWLHMFSASEFQRLISGDTAPIDLQDLRRHTKYFGGFHNNHRVVCWLWDILESDFTPEEHRLFLKFVTSCSKPPLLGFDSLEPPFSIRCVEVSDDQDLGDTVGSVLRGFFAIRRSDPVDRLPTSSTCFNLLKLPNYQRRSTLREKLRYAICSSPGFELS